MLRLLPPLLNVLGYEASMLFGVVGAVVTLLTVELPYKRENFKIWWVLNRKDKSFLCCLQSSFLASLLFLVSDQIGLEVVGSWFVIPICTVVIVTGLVGVVAQFTSVGVRSFNNGSIAFGCCIPFVAFGMARHQYLDTIS